MGSGNRLQRRLVRHEGLEYRENWRGLVKHEVQESGCWDGGNRRTTGWEGPFVTQRCCQCLWKSENPIWAILLPRPRSGTPMLLFSSFRHSQKVHLLARRLGLCPSVGDGLLSPSWVQCGPNTRPHTGPPPSCPGN